MNVRARALLLGLTASLGLAAPAAAAAEDLGSTIARIDPIGELLAAPDGGAWGVSERGTSLWRFDAGGALANGGEPLWLGNARSSLAPLHDGSFGIVWDGAGYGVRDVPRTPFVLRLRGASVTRAQTLPAAFAAAPPAALAPDGTAWAARTCGDRVTRVTARGAVRSFRLSALGCRAVDEWVTPENAQRILPSADGSVWIVNRCQGRVVRVDRRERVREWRIGSYCTEDDRARVLPTRAQVDADGSLRLDGLRIAPGGAPQREPRLAVPDATTADGSEWTARGDGRAIEQRTPTGETREIPLTTAWGGARYAWRLVGGGASLWFISSIVPRFGETYSRTNAPRLFGTITTAGVHTEKTLVGPNANWGGDLPALAAGSDGRAWTISYAGREYLDMWSGWVVRFDVGQTPAAARPRVTRVLGRDERRLWLQLACAAPAGRYCDGRLTLTGARGRSALRAPAPYLIPGGARAALAVQLTPATVRDRGTTPRLRATLRERAGARVAQTVTVPR